MQDLDLGEGKQYGSRVVVVLETRVCLLGGMKNFEFKSSQIASDAVWDKIVV